MKAISNIQYINNDLRQADPDWQKTVFAETGVIVSPLIRYVTLISTCGFIDLDSDAVYSYADGDSTEYCTIETPQQLAEYIREMPSCSSCLSDVDLGGFTKSQLYWAVWNRIILPECNRRRDGEDLVQDWSLRYIRSEGDSLVFMFDLIEYDEAELEVGFEPGDSLDDVLFRVCGAMNSVTADIEEIADYSVADGEADAIPGTYEEVIKLYDRRDVVFVGI